MQALSLSSGKKVQRIQLKRVPDLSDQFFKANRERFLSGEIPDYSNPFTKATESRLGQFQYSPLSFSQDLVTRKPCQMANGAIYEGEWTHEGLRQGKGCQVWEDGTKYIGNWKNDMANGRGRLIHPDGDCY